MLLYVYRSEPTLCLSPASGSGVPGLGLLSGAGKRREQVCPVPEDGSRERSECPSRCFQSFIYGFIAYISPPLPLYHLSHSALGNGVSPPSPAFFDIHSLFIKYLHLHVFATFCCSCVEIMLSITIATNHVRATAFLNVPVLNHTELL